MRRWQGYGEGLIKERVLAGEIQLARELRRYHPVPPALTDFDKALRCTAFRPYPAYRHPERVAKNQLPAYDPEDSAA